MRRLPSLALLLLAIGLAGCGEREREHEPAAGPEPVVVLAGDGEMWTVAPDSGRVRHIRRPELAPGDAPHRVVRRGSRFVFWGYDVYSAADPAGPLQRIAEDGWIFVPSVHPDRVWVGRLKDGTPATRNELGSLTEVAADGTVTEGPVTPPEGRWPDGAVSRGLLFASDHELVVWDPSSGREHRRLASGFVGGSHGDRFARCADPCRTLALVDASDGSETQVAAPDGRFFEPATPVFSPSGDRLAVALHEGSAEGMHDIGLVDARSGELRMLEGMRVPGYYVFLDFSADGRRLYATGGVRFEARTLLEYRLDTGVARRIDVEVGDFYDMAAR